MKFRRFIPLAALLLLSLTPGAAQAAHMCGGVAATIHGTDGPNSLLTWGAGDNILIGTPGNDVFWAGSGDDILIGLDGNDIFCPGPGFDTVIGGPGVDTLDYSGLTAAPPPGDWGVWVEMLGGQSTEYAYDSGDTFVGIEVVNGTNFADSISGSAGDDVIRGLGGSDELTGAYGADVIEGGDGSDVIGASGVTGDAATMGTDVVRGGPGNDTVNGNNNPVHVEGGPGDDELHGSNADDLLIGGDGNDFADGEPGMDTCTAEALVSCET